MSTREQVAELQQRLQGFHDPDTGSEFEGWLDPGRYPVLEYRQNFPTPDTDFARLLAPTLGAGDTWICARWRDDRYAEVRDASAPAAPVALDIGDTDLAVPESNLIA